MKTGLATILTLLTVWLAVGALVGFAAWFLNGTVLFFAVAFALRVDGVTREILRRRDRSRDRDVKKLFDD